MAEAVYKAERVVLSRELSAFLVEISIALHKHAMYPARHPSLEPAAARVTARAERLLEDPIDVLTQPGKLSEEERLIINRHPADGARIIMLSDESLDLAAVVAYEHHIMLDGGGYPTMHYNRACALASRLVHVCDVFDALRTQRPYRDAWESERACSYLLERAGTEFDPDLVTAFINLLQRSETQLGVLADERVAGDEIPVPPDRVASPTRRSGPSHQGPFENRR